MNPPHSTEAPSLVKTLRWYDGFVLALPIATGLFISVGYVIGAIGAIPAIALGAILTIVALLQNMLFAEMAAMFRWCPSQRLVNWDLKPSLRIPSPTGS